MNVECPSKHHKDTWRVFEFPAVRAVLCLGHCTHKDHDAPHENGAESRGRAIGVEEQPDAPRSHAPQGAGDETSKAWCTETIHLNAVAHVTEDGGEVENIPVVIGRAKTEGASNKAHASPKTPPVRSAQTRGLTNTANTCFLNASLQCLVRV